MVKRQAEWGEGQAEWEEGPSKGLDVRGQGPRSGGEGDDQAEALGRVDAARPRRSSCLVSSCRRQVRSPRSFAPVADTPQR